MRLLIEAPQNRLRGFAAWPPAPNSRSANASAAWRAARSFTIRSAARRKFSTSTIRRVIATAQSSPIRQRLHALIGLYKAAQHLRLEAAVGMRDERPCHSEYARITLKRPVRKFGQPTIKPARKILADLANLFLRDIKVIDQPFGRRSDCAFLPDGLGGGAICLEQHPAVVPQPFCQPSASAPSGRDPLGLREAFGMLLEAFDAEQFRANRFVRFLRETGRYPFERA